MDAGRLSLRVLVDTSSVEVFAQAGTSVITDLILPETSGLGFQIEATGAAENIRVRSLSLWPLRAAPPTTVTITKP
jgi:sucrose-6-phosphate hydrolase SacC (GH32 family)